VSADCLGKLAVSRILALVGRLVTSSFAAGSDPLRIAALTAREFGRLLGVVGSAWRSSMAVAGAGSRHVGSGY